jgi:hypothetical protein
VLLLDTNNTACPTKDGSIPGIGSVIICTGLTTEFPVLASNSDTIFFNSSSVLVLLLNSSIISS